MIDRFKIRRTTFSDISKIIELSTENIGDGYLNAKTLEDAIDDGIHHIYVIESGKTIDAFCLNMIIPVAELPEYFELLPFMFLELTMACTMIGIIKTIVVDKKAQKKGMGAALVAESVKQLTSMQVGGVMSIAWVHDGKIPADRVLSSAGLRQITTVNDFWRQDSETHGYVCLRCGDPPCECAAVLYFGEV